MQGTQLLSILLSGLLLGAVVLPLPLAAQGIDRQQARQRQRIQRGLAEGSLTPREAWRLRREQRQIRVLERRFWMDGRLEPWERRTLRRAQRNASRHIYWSRHNRRHQ
ncbi:MAG: hypothetical protein AB7N91_19815 [Candidatus Tectimicrobiota bacterium]